MGKLHLVIPDAHVKTGIDLRHFEALGNLIVSIQPEVIVDLGDHWDMPSLSSYDVGKKTMEGRRYKEDIIAGREAYFVLFWQLKHLQERQAANKKKVYRPYKHFLMGNHEHRIERAVNSDPKLHGTISTDDLRLNNHFDFIHEFNKVVNIDGINYAHYFTSGNFGKPAPSAKVAHNEAQGSAVQGHVQKREVYHNPKHNTHGIFTGIFYTHKEDYLGEQGNNLEPGVWLFHDVDNGRFDPEFISVNRLVKNYG